METNEISDRIKQLMEEMKLTSIAFAERIGIQQSTLSHILNGRNKASLDVIMKIQQQFPKISYYWLLNGEGDMYTNNRVIVDATSNYQSQEMPGLFDQNREKSANIPSRPENRQEFVSKSPIDPPKEIVRQEIQYVEKPQKNIIEIRIFFDDNTFQIFTCEK
jgi:transcriptional regulator with XRE-family HTH domain